ncbi:hypoxia up-regulated protein 1-like [Eriocheir sinensis]|uniref:hypoxia up-regulated protein 1-like n=1 Tax=Eriocheir sinensis TaxID=95602 RepID=UPI0021C755E7|nr:hypoxia up-regulated protein 1-like [Eriocheir sinensis]
MRLAAGWYGGPAAVAAAVMVALLAMAGGGEAVTIMSIDFGTEWMKVAVVAPGVPMEIALNKESKRKTPIAIAFRNNERTFGEDALTNGVRSPPSNYFYLLDLLGKRVEGSAVVEVFRQRFPFYNIEADPERGTVVFRHDSNTTYTVEELVGQLLGHARDLAAAHTDQRIKDCVITVPAFFNQAERRALLTAAQLTGLKVLSLMSSNAAVALNYGMFRRKEVNGTAQHILFYDMGASSTTATIAAYQTVKIKERGYSETNPQVTILGVGYDRLLGGLAMQLRLRDHLAKKFEEVKKTKNSVYDSPRGMAKLLKEAGRMAKVLSANSEHLSQVEGVLDEEDFKLHIKREEFEEMCADIFERVRAPVDAALISAGMDISTIDQFIIVGGATRIPRIQQILQELWGRELGKNINADEAAAMGAVYRAADLGQGFKVKKFHVKESVLFPIEVDFERKVENAAAATADPSDPPPPPMSKVVKRSLFAVGNNYPQKKVMTFNKHTADFSFAVNYGVNEHLPKNELRMANVQNLSTVEVSGVTAAFEKQVAEGADPKGIKAHFHMDDSGVLSLVGMEAVFEKQVMEEVVGAPASEEEESTLSRLGSTISKLFTGAEEEKETEGKENQTKEEGKSETTNKNKEEKEEKKKENKDKKKEEKEKEGEEKKKEKKEMKSKQVVVKEELNFTVTYLDLPEMTPEAIKLSQKKLQDISALEEARHEKEAARNTLESYILDAQDKLYQEEYEAASTDKQREDVRQLCSQLDEWIYDEGFDQPAPVYKTKLEQLSKLFEPIKRRVEEHRDRPEAIQALLDMINGSSTFLQKAREVPEEHQLFTDVELTTLDSLIVDTQKWMEEKMELQEARALHEDPKLTLSDVAEKWTAMDREIKYLINKAKIVKAKKDREAAEAKIKAEKEAKEAEKKKKNTTAEEKKKKNGGEEEEKKEEEVVGGDEIKNKEEKEAKEEGGEEEKKKKKEEEEEEEDPLNIFQENQEENNSEGDRRKEEEGEEEEEEVEVVGGEEEEEEIKDEEDEEEEKKGDGDGSGNAGHTEL